VLPQEEGAEEEEEEEEAEGEWEGFAEGRGDELGRGGVGAAPVLVEEEEVEAVEAVEEVVPFTVEERMRAQVRPVANSPPHCQIYLHIVRFTATPSDSPPHRQIYRHTVRFVVSDTICGGGGSLQSA
jgi:hypothetical protein